MKGHIWNMIDDPSACNKILQKSSMKNTTKPVVWRYVDLYFIAAYLLLLLLLL
jgi:hypothetical protein